MNAPRPLSASRRRLLQTLGAGLAALPFTSAFAPAALAAPLGSPAGSGAGPATSPPPVLPRLLDGDPGDDAFWALVRAQYPLTRDRVYLNTGGLGPAPYVVLDAVSRTTMELQRVSEHGHDRMSAVRAPIAAFFGCAPEELAFMRNATEANSTIAAGLRTLRRGDELLIDLHAHPGGSIPWLNRARVDGLRVTTFDPDAESEDALLARIERAITPRTRALQISHVTAPTGIRMPAARIAEIARRRGLWFHIDGAQSAGMMPVDVRALGCDSYATSGHKWMGGPHGTGLLYVRRDRLDDILPTETGAYTASGYTLPPPVGSRAAAVPTGTTSPTPGSLAYVDNAERYEPGTRDASGLVGLAAATTFLTTIGMERVEAHGRALARRVADGLRATPGVRVLTPEDPALSAAIVTFRADRVAYGALYTALLRDHALRCRVVSEQGLDAVRASLHVFNSAEEADRLVAAVADIVARA